MLLIYLKDRNETHKSEVTAAVNLFDIFISRLGHGIANLLVPNQEMLMFQSQMDMPLDIQFSFILKNEKVMLLQCFTVHLLPRLIPLCCSLKTFMFKIQIKWNVNHTCSHVFYDLKQKSPKALSWINSSFHSRFEAFFCPQVAVLSESAAPTQVISPRTKKQTENSHIFQACSWQNCRSVGVNLFTKHISVEACSQIEPPNLQFVYSMCVFVQSGAQGKATPSFVIPVYVAAVPKLRTCRWKHTKIGLPQQRALIFLQLRNVKERRRKE